jgi:uncharacterized membrane protein
MDTIVATLKAWQLHPVADHFTIAILIVAVLVDLTGSVITTRTWIRYMALTLMILGAIAAWSSMFTGGWEAHRLAKEITGPAKEVLHRHAELGEALAWVFAALALWRIGVQFFGFMSGSRGLYLVIAVLAIVALGYQGHEGGVLVYDYGVGTALMAKSASSPAGTPTKAAAPAESTPLPTVYAPTPTAASLPTPSPAASPTATPSPTPTSSPTPTPTSAPFPTPTAEPAAPPTPSGGEATATPSATSTPGNSEGEGASARREPCPTVGIGGRTV